MFEQQTQSTMPKRKPQGRSSRWLAFGLGGMVLLNISLIALIVLLVFMVVQQSESMDTATDVNTSLNVSAYQTAAPQQVVRRNVVLGTTATPTPFVIAQVNVNSTPTQTLRPPPTLEAPTATVLPSLTPSPTPIPTLDSGRANLDINGLETPTPTEEACELEDSWALRYEVQANDALANIATRYNTTVQRLATANCLTDSNLIRVGQQLRVPGDTQPQDPEYTCGPYELLSPVNNAYTIPGSGQLSFSWRGPRAPLYLIRITQPNGEQFEQLIELRQNEAIDLFVNLRQSGQHTWYVYPLGRDYLQIPCAEGGPWTFFKAPPPTDTPTPTANGGLSGL